MRAFGSKVVPFETEQEARAFLLCQGYIQLQVPHGRRFMRSSFVNDESVYEIEPTIDGTSWVIQKIEPQSADHATIDNCSIVVDGKTYRGERVLDAVRQFLREERQRTKSV